MGGNPWIPTHFIYPSNIPQHLAIPPAKNVCRQRNVLLHILRERPRLGCSMQSSANFVQGHLTALQHIAAGTKIRHIRKTGLFAVAAPLYCHNAAPNTHPAAEKWKDGSLPAAAAAPLHRVPLEQVKIRKIAAHTKGLPAFPAWAGNGISAIHWFAATGTSPLPAASYTGSAENGYSQKTPHTFPAQHHLTAAFRADKINRNARTLFRRLC